MKSPSLQKPLVGDQAGRSCELQWLSNYLKEHQQGRNAKTKFAADYSSVKPIF